MVKILHGDWSIRLGENRRDHSSQTLAVMPIEGDLSLSQTTSITNGV